MTNAELSMYYRHKWKSNCCKPNSDGQDFRCHYYPANVPLFTRYELLTTVILNLV